MLLWIVADTTMTIERDGDINPHCHPRFRGDDIEGGAGRYLSTRHPGLHVRDLQYQHHGRQVQHTETEPVGPFQIPGIKPGMTVGQCWGLS